jgi:hypothetical protein
MNQLIVWVLLTVVHPGTHAPSEFIGVYQTQDACEHMLAALSDPEFNLPNTKPRWMICQKIFPGS